MNRNFFLSLMEQEACRRYMSAHAEYVAKAISPFTDKINNADGAHWEELERRRVAAERKKARHERWLRLLCEHWGISVA